MKDMCKNCNGYGNIFVNNYMDKNTDSCSKCPECFGSGYSKD